MRHLIPYLQDDNKAADYLRQLRWPDGAVCPHCENSAIEKHERCGNGLQRYNCPDCTACLGQHFATLDGHAAPTETQPPWAGRGFLARGET